MAKYTSRFGENIWYQMILCQRYQNPISIRHVRKKITIPLTNERRVNR